MPKKNQRFSSSFVCALAGLGAAYLGERNFRRHLSCAVLVIYGGFLFGFESGQWIAVALTIGVVLFAELINTALERMTDFFCAEQSDIARAVKDISAGGVLVCAVSAAVVGAVLLWQPERFPEIIDQMIAAPLIPALVASAAFLIVRLPDRMGKEKRGEKQ